MYRYLVLGTVLVGMIPVYLTFTLYNNLYCLIIETLIMDLWSVQYRRTDCAPICNMNWKLFFSVPLVSCDHHNDKCWNRTDESNQSRGFIAPSDRMQPCI